MSELARVAYEKMFPDRLADFPHSPGYIHFRIKDHGKLWRHELRHDAESAFWMLVWWAVHASPKDGVVTEIPCAVWARLDHTLFDPRKPDFPIDALDPSYSPLNDLLNKLGDALTDDLHWATEKPHTHPEFLHEVFQRHILNFILANQDEHFMRLPKADTPRKPSPSTKHSLISAWRLMQ